MAQEEDPGKPNRALHAFAAEGDVDGCFHAIQSGADVNDMGGKYGRTPLAQAVINGHLDVASLLLENGANPDGRDYGTETALHAAVHAPHPELVFLIAEASLQIGGDSLDAQGMNGETPMHRAARADSAAAVSALLELGASVDVIDDFGRTPMHFAARDGALDCLVLLRAAGAGFDRDKRGRTPLHAAASAGRTESVALLVALGADPAVADTKGHTAADVAARHSHRDVLRFLVEGQASASEVAISRAVALANPSAAAEESAPETAAAATEAPAGIDEEVAAAATPAAPAVVPAAAPAEGGAEPAAPLRRPSPRSSGAASSSGELSQPGTPVSAPATPFSAPGSPMVVNRRAPATDISIEAVPIPLPVAELLYRVPPTKAYEGLFEGGKQGLAGGSSGDTGAAALMQSGALSQLFDSSTLKELYGSGQLGPVFASDRLVKLMGSGELGVLARSGCLPVGSCDTRAAHAAATRAAVVAANVVSAAATCSGAGPDGLSSYFSPEMVVESLGSSFASISTAISSAFTAAENTFDDQTSGAASRRPKPTEPAARAAPAARMVSPWAAAGRPPTQPSSASAAAAARQMSLAAAAGQGTAAAGGPGTAPSAAQKGPANTGAPVGRTPSGTVVRAGENKAQQLAQQQQQQQQRLVAPGGMMVPPPNSRSALPQAAPSYTASAPGAAAVPSIETGPPGSAARLSVATTKPAEAVSGPSQISPATAAILAGRGAAHSPKLSAAGVPGKSAQTTGYPMLSVVTAPSSPPSACQAASQPTTPSGSALPPGESPANISEASAGEPAAQLERPRAPVFAPVAPPKLLPEEAEDPTAVLSFLMATAAAFDGPGEALQLETLTGRQSNKSPDSPAPPTSSLPASSRDEEHQQAAELQQRVGIPAARALRSRSVSPPDGFPLLHEDVIPREGKNLQSGGICRRDGYYDDEDGMAEEDVL